MDTKKQTGHPLDCNCMNDNHSTEHSQKHCSDTQHQHLDNDTAYNQETAKTTYDLSNKTAASTYKYTYLLDHLGCANCAAKMEKKINELSDVSSAVITFPTKKLSLTTNYNINLLPKLQEICSSIENEVVVVELDSSNPHTKKETKKSLFPIISIIGGAALFVLGELTEQSFPTISFIILLFAYLLLGWKIVRTAVKNMFQGQIFDENFLMTIATLGAFAIREYPEAVGVMLFYRIGEFFEEKAVEKSRSQIMQAVDLRPETVTLVTEHDTKTIDASLARPDDIVLVRPGDRIPLDGVIIEGVSRLDTSAITGEPVPITVFPGSQVTSGCINTSGLLKMKVEKPLSESMVTRILDSVENATANKPKIDSFITKFAAIYTPFVVLLSICTAIIPSLITGDWNHWIYTALTFLVISCPCALVLSVPLAFFAGIGRSSKHNILLKGGISLEALKNVKAVVMDKTGTITKGNFVVQKVISTSDYTNEELLDLASKCEQTSTHPIGVSIVAAAKEHINQETYTSKYNEPAAIKEVAGEGILATFDSDIVLIGNQKLMQNHSISLSDYQPATYGTEVLIAKDGALLGYFLISDTIKEDSKTSISALKSMGLTTVMLTGDEENSAKSIAQETGIEEVYAKLLPEQKLEQLQQVRNQHGAVLFVGDGINDAPVLAGADIGAAMGSGSDAAIEAADVVFMTSNMSAVPTAIEIAKKTNRIAMQNVVFALVIKAIVMVLGLAGIASMWMAVFADTGVAMLCVLNAVRMLYQK